MRENGDKFIIYNLVFVLIILMRVIFIIYCHMIFSVYFRYLYSICISVIKTWMEVWTLRSVSAISCMFATN